MRPRVGAVLRQVSTRVVGEIRVADPVGGGAEAVARAKAVCVSVHYAGHVSIAVVAEGQVVSIRARRHRSRQPVECVVGITRRVYLIWDGGAPAVEPAQNRPVRTRYGGAPKPDAPPATLHCEFVQFRAALYIP